MPDPDQNAGSAPAADIESARHALRREHLRQRTALSATVHETLSAQICAQLSRNLAAMPSGTLGFCMPFRREPDISPLLPVLVAAGWQLCVPVVVATGSTMEFRTWQPGAATTLDRHGITIPLTPVAPAPALLLLPVVAVDTKGYRLGYGGGYFDRTVAALAAAGQRPHCIGVGFELARVVSIHPQAHDQALDRFVSEVGTTDFTVINRHAP